MLTKYLFAALIVLAPLAAAAQDTEKHVYVTVVDAKEQLPIGGLTAEHFAVREAGKDRVVVRAEPIKTPMHVAVLVDMTAIGGPDETFRSAVVDFVERLAVNNQVAVYGCWNSGFRAVPYTMTDPVERKAAVSKLVTFPSTQSLLLDTINKAIVDFQAVESKRPVIVALSSVSVESSSATAGSVIKKLIAESIQFHVVSLANQASGAVSGASGDIPQSSQKLGALMAGGEGDRERNQLIKQGPTSTGGSHQRVVTTMALDAAFRRLFGELAASYDVTFTRPGNDKLKDLQVGILLEDVTLRATSAPFGRSH